MLLPEKPREQACESATSVASSEEAAAEPFQLAHPYHRGDRRRHRRRRDRGLHRIRSQQECIDAACPVGRATGFRFVKPELRTDSPRARAPEAQGPQTFDDARRLTVAERDANTASDSDAGL